MKEIKIKIDSKRLNLLKNIIENDSVRQISKRKANVILLKAEGKNTKTIHEITGISKRTIIYYLNGYINEELRYIHRNEYKKSILKQGGKIEEEFQNSPPLSYKEAAKRIEKIYNIHISESACRRYLNKHNIFTKRSIKFYKKKGCWKLN